MASITESQKKLLDKIEHGKDHSKLTSKEASDKIQAITGSKGGGKKGGSSDASIEAQVCLKCACEIRKESDTIDIILANAEKMRRWIRSDQPKSAPVQTKPPAAPKPAPEEPKKEVNANMDWIKESIDILSKADPDTWGRSSVVEQLRQAGAKGDRISDMINSLPIAEQARFIVHIEEAREKLEKGE